jgi:hypothetical protein
MKSLRIRDPQSQQSITLSYYNKQIFIIVNLRYLTPSNRTIAGQIEQTGCEYTHLTNKQSRVNFS